jgi:uncharacterized protein
MIPPRINIVTLGVRDLAASTRFYETLGWVNSPASQEGKISFFALDNVVFGLFPRDQLADDAGVPDAGDGRAFRGVTLAINANSEVEVDAFLKSAIDAGAQLVKPGQKVFWGGYSGYFADPDRHLWEVAFNPFMPLDENGLMTNPG